MSLGCHNCSPLPPMVFLLPHVTEAFPFFCPLSPSRLSQSPPDSTFSSYLDHCFAFFPSHRQLGLIQV